MAGQNLGVNMEKFEEYFKRADLDRDGRISGAEAVSFFQGSNLPKQVLAQIWMYADQRHTGFLDRPEFYNALRLVTVAQSKRELTPEIVKAAIYGPAAAKIPPPQINLPASPAPQINVPASPAPQINLPASPAPQINHPATLSPQINSMVNASATQMGAIAPTASQNPGYRSQPLPNASMTQQYFPQQNHSMRPPQGMPASTASRPPMGIPGSEFARQASMVGPGGPNSTFSSNWLSGSSGGAPTGPGGVSPSLPSPGPRPQVTIPVSSQPTPNDSKALVTSGNGFASNSGFGGDVFSVTQSKQEPQASTYSTISPSASSVSVPVSSGQHSVKPNPLDVLNAFPTQPGSGHLQRPQPPVNPSGQSSVRGSSLSSAGDSVGPVNTTSESSQLLWPKMKPSDVQKYTKVFMEVDTDRDGKITGEQARSLFLSWRLPREVLKQVWDLSDQDSDSMLSLREFCFALYLMERYREGRPLPAALPSNVMYDETLLSMTGQPKVNYGNAAWGSHPGFGQQQGMPGARPGAPPTGLRPPTHVAPSQADSVIQSNQQKPKLEDPFDQFNSVGQNPKPQEITDEEKKVEETENIILDSREKIEFYRTKMQDLVLYKSRCDNRLNEITERASADKREAESLGKKYEEKYKQVAEIASKLTIEEARLRDVQGRKMELHQAIVKMEQGGSADGILQVRADRIQSDLEELLKALAERCKKHGLDVKSTAVIELPIGWQPGVPEGAVDWDEDWDKFEDEGFDNELKVDGKNVSVPSKPESISVERENVFSDDSLTPESLSNADGKSFTPSSNRDNALESESAYAHSEDDLSRSPLESPSKDSSDHFDKSHEADAETQRSFDESTWGAFDNNDDVDSVWGFNTKDPDSDKHNLFGSGDFAVTPISTGSPSAESMYNKKSPFTFEDSVPSTPLSRFGNSPPRYSEGFGDRFDSFSRFDSFNTHDSGFSTQPERFSRFDSINSSKDFGNSNERFTRFDSMNSSKDFGTSHGFSSVDDSDPFGTSGPFKVSSDDQTPKKGSNSWNAF